MRSERLDPFRFAQLKMADKSETNSRSGRVATPIEQLRQQLSAKEEECKKLSDAVKKKGDLNQTEHVEIRKLQDTIRAQQDTIQAQQGTIQGQQSTIEAQQATIQAQQDTIQAQQGTIQEEQDAIHDQEEQSWHEDEQTEEQTEFRKNKGPWLWRWYQYKRFRKEMATTHFGESANPLYHAPEKQLANPLFGGKAASMAEDTTAEDEQTAFEKKKGPKWWQKRQYRRELKRYQAEVATTRFGESKKPLYALGEKEIQNPAFTGEAVSTAEDTTAEDDLV